MPFTPKKILITGGAGFIGANFIRTLLQDPTPPELIVNLDLLTYAGSKQNLMDLPTTAPMIFIHGDINNKALVIDLLQQHHIDTIVHFAAESHVDRSIVGPEAFIQTNVVGTFTLLEAAKTVWLQEHHWNAEQCHFHHISTDEVYGSLSLHAPAFHEQTAYAPNSPYSASKAASDHLVRAYYHTYGLPITMSHCSNNYGPYQHAEKFIPTIIRCCLQQLPIPVYGNGQNIRDWIYVADHCQGVLQVLRQGELGQTYHLGGHCEQSNLDVVGKICQLLDEFFPNHAPHKKLIQFVTDRAGHDFRYSMDITRVKNELGWQPKEDFISGLRKTVSFITKSNMVASPDL